MGLGNATMNMVTLSAVLVIHSILQHVIVRMNTLALELVLYNFW
jgi:hypothetical protein